MGICKTDIHKAEREYQHLHLTHADVIKALIKHRSSIDKYQGIEHNNYFDVSGDVYPVNQELLILFADLDNLINDAKLNVKQRFIIDKLMEGYNEADVGNMFNQSRVRIAEMLDTVSEKLAKLARLNWKYNYIYMSVLPSPWGFKTCSRCGESLPLTEDFFGKNSRNSDGFKGVCKMC